MDLQALNVGTVTTKAWLKPVCGTVTAGNITTDILTANTVDFKTIETNSLTLVSQVSVPNPSVGSQTLFVDSGNGLLSAQDSLGNTTPYLPTTGGTMTGAIDFKNNVTLGAFMDNSVTNTNTLVGQGTVGAAADNCVAIGPNIIQINGTENVVMGHGAQVVAPGSNSTVVIGAASQAVNTSFGVAIGRAALVFGTANISLGLGANSGSGGGHDNISIGEAVSGAGAGVHDAIAIGNNTNNSTSSSCQIGDLAITNIRPNNASLCDLGTTVAPFKTAWLRDAAPASGCKYSQYGSVTVTNTAADTSYATGTAVGSLTLSAHQTPGTVIRFKANLAYSEVLADSSTFRIKVNGVAVVAMAVGPGLFVAQGMDIEGQIVVLGGGNAQCELRVLLETEPVGITNATSAYDETIANTLDFSIQYTAADPGNTLVCNCLFVETLFAQ